MKIPSFFLSTTSLLHFRLEQRGWRIDRNVVLHRLGRALGMVA